MGYKESRNQFEMHYKTWSSFEFWEEWSKDATFDDLMKQYGRAKLDCLIAENKFKEDLSGLNPSDEGYWELFDWANKAEHTGQIIDDIMLSLINW